MPRTGWLTPRPRGGIRVGRRRPEPGAHVGDARLPSPVRDRSIRLTGPPEADPFDPWLTFACLGPIGRSWRMPRWFSRRLVPASPASRSSRSPACTSSTRRYQRRPAGPARRRRRRRSSSPRTARRARSTTPRSSPRSRRCGRSKTGVEPQFFESYTGSTTQAAERRERVGRRRRGALARARRADDPGRGPDHPRLDRRRPTRAWSRARSSCSTCGPATRRASRTGTTSRSRGTGVLTPDPEQSGGARWNLVSPVGRRAARRRPRHREGRRGRGDRR